MGDDRDRHPSGGKEPLPWERHLATVFTVERYRYDGRSHWRGNRWAPEAADLVE